MRKDESGGEWDEMQERVRRGAGSGRMQPPLAVVNQPDAETIAPERVHSVTTPLLVVLATLTM
jgi:hypothetical protein